MNVVFYESWWDTIQKLDEKSQEKMTRAILDYGCKGIEPKFEDPMLNAVFEGMIRGAIDKSQQHYQEKVTYG